MHKLEPVTLLRRLDSVGEDVVLRQLDEMLLRATFPAPGPVDHVGPHGNTGDHAVAASAHTILSCPCAAALLAGFKDTLEERERSIQAGSDRLREMAAPFLQGTHRLWRDAVRAGVEGLGNLSFLFCGAQGHLT